MHQTTRATERKAAGALPAVLVLLIIYWLPLVKRDGVRPSLWRYLLGAAAFALLWAYLGPTLV